MRDYFLHFISGGCFNTQTTQLVTTLAIQTWSVIDSQHRITVPHLQQDKVGVEAGLRRLVGDGPVVQDDSIVMLCHQLKTRVAVRAQCQGGIECPRVTASEAVSRLLTSRSIKASTADTPVHSSSVQCTGVLAKFVRCRIIRQVSTSHTWKTHYLDLLLCKRLVSTEYWVMSLHVIYIFIFISPKEAAITIEKINN